MPLPSAHRSTLKSRNGNLIVDIGGGTTDIAVLSLNGIVNKKSIKIAGDTINDAIVRYVRNSHGVLIGEKMADQIKRQVASVCWEEGEDISAPVKGRNLTTGLPCNIEISRSMLYDCVIKEVEQIITAVKEVIERTPPELVGDIHTNGITLTGGGSLLHGIAPLLEKHTRIHTVIAEDPVNWRCHRHRKILPVSGQAGGRICHPVDAEGVAMPDFSYTMEQLAPDLSVRITRDHRFGTDAFLLSDFAAVRRKDLACDLGTGCGIIPLLWFRDRQQGPKMAYGVDIQPLAVEQLRFTIEQSDLGQRMQAVQADLSDLAALKEKLPFGSFDLVTCNPPYKKAEHGILSSSDSDIIARHETMCSIDDVCAAAAKLLQFGGRLCILPATGAAAGCAGGDAPP